jgi:flagellar assembly protein FliH
MSCKGRRLTAADVEHFAWTPTADYCDPVAAVSEIWRPVPDPVTAESASPPAPQVVARDGAVSDLSPPAPALSTVEQQAHLAALERDAFTKGYAQGERTGLEAGATRADAMLRRVAQTLEELSSLREAMVKQTEQQLVQLAVAIARRILQREVSIDPDLTAALAHIALDRLGPSTPAVIRLHPEDYAVVTTQQGNDWAGRQVQVVSDPAVARGGCLVQSEFGYIDASVNAQVDQIARLVLGEDVGAAAWQKGAA